MLVNIFIIDITVELPSDVTATPQQYIVKCIIAGKNVIKLNFYCDDTDLNDTTCNVQSNGFSCTKTKDNGGNNRLTYSTVHVKLNFLTRYSCNCNAFTNALQGAFATCLISALSIILYKLYV